MKKPSEQILKNYLETYKQIRKGWVVSPVTKIVPNKKKYNRKLTKQQLYNILKREDL